MHRRDSNISIFALTTRLPHWAHDCTARNVNNTTFADSKSLTYNKTTCKPVLNAYQNANAMLPDVRPVGYTNI